MVRARFKDLTPGPKASPTAQKINWPRNSGGNRLEVRSGLGYSVLPVRATGLTASRPCAAHPRQSANLAARLMRLSRIGWSLAVPESNPAYGPANQPCDAIFLMAPCFVAQVVPSIGKTGFARANETPAGRNLWRSSPGASISFGHRPTWSVGGNRRQSRATGTQGARHRKPPWAVAHPPRCAGQPPSLAASKVFAAPTAVAPRSPGAPEPPSGPDSIIRCPSR